MQPQHSQTAVIPAKWTPMELRGRMNLICHGQKNRAKFFAIFDNFRL